MQTREIDYDRWPKFLAEFTQLHQGEHVNVETIGQGPPDVRSELYDLPLIGIVGADPKAMEWIEVIAGEVQDNPATHSIPHPSRVVIAEEENGRSIALQIDSEQGITTMIRFEPSVEGMPAGFTVV